jgi:hypothetical protein
VVGVQMPRPARRVGSSVACVEVRMRTPTPMPTRAPIVTPA